MNNKIKRWLALAGLLVSGVVFAGRPPSPFKVTAAVLATNQQQLVRVSIFVPPDHVVYADHFHFESLQGDALTPVALPPAATAVDKATGKERAMYDQPFYADLDAAHLGGTGFLVKLQGCSNSACFFPEKHYFQLGTDGTCAEVDAPAAPAAEVTAAADWQGSAKGFKVLGQQTGYLKSGEFVEFLQKAKTGQLGQGNDPLAKYKQAGIVVTMLLILLGGMGLNLTPCVLPLIPINLAIIGAGKAAHTRKAGFLHGAAYGLGMSLAYGGLGLVIVLTGAKFGTLNSSVWFNVIISVIFVLLSLAMFDVFHIDFSRFDKGLGKQESKAAHHTKSKWLVAFTLGAIAALLAGACVAPVVISVLLMAANFYAKGLVVGLALPFLLGLGMALPWPFMGASLSFLPKPGKWMVWVKYVFGVLILVFAGYYGWLAYGLAKSHGAQTSLAAAGTGKTVANANELLAAALNEARATKKPVFLDFKASWCKNCEAMDATVFNQPEVQKSLGDFVVVQYPAERPNESPAKEVLDRFGVLGLPTYVVLQPEQ
jgi:thioredoxin:protein disulfide reductase